MQKQTDYIGNYVYEDNKLSFILTDKGRIVPDSSGFAYEYFIKDHLGNTRLVVKDTAVMSEAHYYPFGLQINALSYTNPLQKVANKYLYNGKELQDDFGLGWYDYGARFYDAEIGRFHTVDPMIEDHYDYTGYAYVYNNPVNLIDPLGLDTLPAIVTPDGNLEPHKELDEIPINPNTQILSVAAEQNKDLGLEKNQNLSEIKEDKPNTVQKLEAELNKPIEDVGDAIIKIAGRAILGIVDDANIYFSSIILGPNKARHLDGGTVNKNEILDAGVMTLTTAIPLQKTGKLIGVGAPRKIVSRSGIVKFKTSLKQFRQGIFQERMTKSIIVGKAAAKSSKRLKEKYK